MFARAGAGAKNRVKLLNCGGQGGLGMRRGGRDEFEHSRQPEAGEVARDFHGAELDALGDFADGAVTIGLGKEGKIGRGDFKGAKCLAADVTQNAVERGNGFVEQGEFIHFKANASDEDFRVVDGEITLQFGGHGALVKFIVGFAPRDELEERMQPGIGTGAGTENDAVFNRYATIEVAVSELEITGRLDIDDVPEDGS